MPVSEDSSLPSVSLREYLPALVCGQNLSRTEAARLVDAILDPASSDVHISAALALLVAKGETADELAGFADALRSRMVCLAGSPDVLDTAGTGASAVKTFNVSSAATLVIAACGAAIAKHGARAATSRSGSADVLEALGIRTNCEPELSARSLRELGVCFLFAPQYHPALARVAPIRKALSFRTTFNLVGPLVNPCLAKYRLLGVSEAARIRTVAEAMSQLCVERAWVLRGDDGLDEITTATDTTVFEVCGSEVVERKLSPEDFGLTRKDPSRARAATIEENAQTVLDVLEGTRKDVARDLVVLNSAAALHVRTGESLRDAAERAAEAIDSGAARTKLEEFRRMTQVAEVAAQ